MNNMQQMETRIHIILHAQIRYRSVRQSSKTIAHVTNWKLGMT